MVRFHSQSVGGEIPLDPKAILRVESTGVPISLVEVAFPSMPFQTL